MSLRYDLECCKLNVKDILSRFKKKDIICFGAGEDGVRFIKLIYGELSIAYFVDNGDIDNCTFLEHDIVNAEYLKTNYGGEPIVITSLAFFEAIASQLEEMGFILGKSFWIWNGLEDDNVNDLEDDNIHEYIELNKKLFSDCRHSETNNKVLIPYRNVLEMSYAPWSYCANYFARKYDANIYCVGGVSDKKNESIWKIYESFNVKGFIDETPNEEMEREISNIYNSIYNGIRSTEDVKNIVVFGNEYGVDILRDYLRLTFPRFHANDYAFKKQLRTMIGYIVFWTKYFNENHSKIKTVIVWDGLYYREGIIRKLAYEYNIPTYTIVNTTAFRWGRDVSFSYEYYKEFFEMLSADEKEKGVDWAKRKLNRHLGGNVEDMLMVHDSPFGKDCIGRVLEKNDLIKVMICHHYMEDDAFPYGEMLFADQWEWLEYLGELSNKTEYDWYLKLHPIEKPLGVALLKKFLDKYKKIKLLPKNVSPQQLKNEGMRYALTIHGSIGYEYPLIGIDVINAGYNPHIAFGFNYNPKTKKEYCKLLEHLDVTSKKINIDEIYQFYCIHFGYHRPRKRDLRNLFFKDWRLQDIRGLIGSKTKCSTELFRFYADEMSLERHEELKGVYATLIDEMDKYEEGIFYKQELSD